MSTLDINSPVWLWGLSVGLLLGVILGVVFARRQHRQRDHRGRGGSVTDWGLSLALVTELRRGRSAGCATRMRGCRLAERSRSRHWLAPPIRWSEGPVKSIPPRAPGESLGHGPVAESVRGSVNSQACMGPPREGPGRSLSGAESCPSPQTRGWGPHHGIDGGRGAPTPPGHR